MRLCISTGNRFLPHGSVTRSCTARCGLDADAYCGICDWKHRKETGEALAKKRLDVLLFEKGLCPSRERAKTAIMEGMRRMSPDRRPDKAGDMVDEDAAA